MKLTKNQRARIRWARDSNAKARGGFWVTLFIYAAMFVLGELLRPKPELENAKPSGLGEFRFPTATEQRVIPLMWGTCRIEGTNTIWYGDLRQEAITTRVKTGLFSSERQTIGFKYHIGIQSGFCLGECDEMLRVWVGDDLVWDFVTDNSGVPLTDGQSYFIEKPKLFGGKKLGTGGVEGELQWFAGSNSQAVSAYLSGQGVDSATISTAGSGYAFNDVVTENGSGTASIRATFRITNIGVGGDVLAIEKILSGTYSVPSASPAATTGGFGSGLQINLTYQNPRQDEGGVTPAYHDLCYTAPLADSVYVGTSANIKAWKWEVNRFPNGLSLTGGKERVNGGANLANVLYEILTNADWGYGVDSTDIDTSNMSAAADTLFNESNGFSFLLDSPEDLTDLVQRVEKQMDGILFVDPLTQKWKIKLIRADYDINTVLEINSTNLLQLTTFTRSTYEGTTNQVRTPFNDQNDDYKGSYGFAQDMANVRIVESNVTTTIAHPGVKTATLANDIAWRELRTLSIPLSQASMIVDRSAYGLRPGDPFGFTDPDIGFVRLPMRVKSIDYGELLDGKIAIEAVQDVFFSSTGVFSPNPGSGWEPPSSDLAPYPTNQQIAMEAPRALTARDPDAVDPTADKVYAAARLQGPESVFNIMERNAVGTPTGDYSEIGTAYGFMLAGELELALNVTAAVPLTSLSIVPVLDTQSALNNAFPTIADLVELGTDLVSLCYIGDSAGTDGEFFLVLSAQISGGNVQLNSVYRGVLDSVMRSHAAGSKVYLLFVGANISLDTVIAGNNVEVKLIPESATDILTESLATAIAFTMDNRTRRPYPPSAFDIEGVTLDLLNVGLDGSGAGEAAGVTFDNFIRRDFRVIDEVAALLSDAGDLTEFSTTYEVEVRDGATVLASTTGLSGASISTIVTKLDILQTLDQTTLPASLVFAARASHTFEAVVYKSRDYLVITSTIVDPLIGKTAFGTLDDSVESTATFTVVADTVDHVFSLSTAFTAGDVEYRLNGTGGFTTLIAAGGTGGTIIAAALTNTDTITVRHTSTDVNPQKLLTMTVSAVEEAYAVLIS